MAAYSSDESGIWTPSVMPTACPKGESASRCRISLDHHRHRKTGPCIPLTVLACSTHGYRFTLYPSGHVPYGRDAAAPVGLDGSALVSPPEVTAHAERFSEPWLQTRFGAVFDAAQGHLWSRGGGGPSWTTQLRRLDELAALLGLAPLPSPVLGERFAHVLDLPRLSLIDDAGRLDGAVGFEERGEILVATLERASKGRCILKRVLSCGALAGLWGAAHLWFATPGGPRCTVFPESGIPSG